MRLRRENKYLGGKTRYAKRVSKLIKRNKTVHYGNHLVVSTKKLVTDKIKREQYARVAAGVLIKLAIVLYICFY